MPSAEEMLNKCGQVISRKRQIAEEKLGISERTELGEEYEELAMEVELLKKWTTQLTNQALICVEPNPGYRVHDKAMNIVDRISSLTTKSEDRPRRKDDGDRRRSSLLGAYKETPYETLAKFMIEAGNGFGADSDIGNTYLKLGECEQKIGLELKTYMINVNVDFLIPLSAFLEGPFRDIQEARSTLQEKRLDYDGEKTKQLRAKTATEADAHLAASQRLKKEFEGHLMQVKQDLRDIVTNSQGVHLTALKGLIEAQGAFHITCARYLNELKAELKM